MAGRQVYIWVVVAMAVVLFFLFFPTMKSSVENVDTTGFLPITTGGVTLLPYAVVAIVFYVLLKALRIL